MSYSHHHEALYAHQGEWVEIECHDGTVHCGIIDHVDDTNVYLQPQDVGAGQSPFGTYFFGAGLLAIGLASIAAISFSPFFW